VTCTYSELGRLLEGGVGVHVVELEEKGSEKPSTDEDGVKVEKSNELIEETVGRRRTKKSLVGSDEDLVFESKVIDSEDVLLLEDGNWSLFLDDNEDDKKDGKNG
jgi:hypothetical protein